MAVRAKRVQAALTTTSATSVYTCPTGIATKIDKLTLSNTAGTDNSGCKVFIGASATTSTQIVVSLTVLASSQENPSVANHTLETGDQIFIKPGANTNLNYRLALTERTQ